MKVHELKTVQPYFNEVYTGRKTFEIRKNDRDYKENDVLILREYYPQNEKESSYRRTIVAKVTYLLSETEFNKEGYVVMAIRVLDND